MLGDDEPLTRSAAVNDLALQRDPGATEAVVVRCAIGLPKRRAWLGDVARNSIKKIRAAR
jgi:hypothetical protein